MANLGANRDKLQKACGKWIDKLDSISGWKEWKRKKFGHTMFFDDPLSEKIRPLIDEFIFPPDIEIQHQVVIQFYTLVQTADSFKDCEYYFRRFPFHNLPVTPREHITNVCEMYFSRFYEMESRLKKYLNSLGKVAMLDTKEIGQIVNFFQNEFDLEIRERNRIQHHERFTDLKIDRLLLIELLAVDRPTSRAELDYKTIYRRLSREWALRTRIKGQIMDSFVDQIALLTLQRCSFLRSLAK